MTKSNQAVRRDTGRLGSLAVLRLSFRSFSQKMRSCGEESQASLGIEGEGKLGSGRNVVERSLS